MKPNTLLPAGAQLIPPKRLTVGNWIPQIVDASVERLGVTWYRVKGGMGERGDREDWIADLPGLCVSVHDYHWNGEDFGANYGSFDNAIRQELKGSLQDAKQRVAKEQLVLSALEKSLGLLEQSL